MYPLDDPNRTLPELIRGAVQNLCQFDHERHENWLTTEADPSVVEVARACPPDRLYRLHWVPNTPGPLMVFVRGYKPAEGGYPAHCVVQVLGSGRLLGAPTEALEDVTAKALAHELPEQIGP